MLSMAVLSCNPRRTMSLWALRPLHTHGSHLEAPWAGDRATEAAKALACP